MLCEGRIAYPSSTPNSRTHLSRVRQIYVICLSILLAAIWLTGCGDTKTLERPQIHYRGNVSELQAYDRLGSATFVTNFLWWDSTGASRQLHDYSGEPVVVVFWRSTLPVSLDELRAIQTMYTSEPHDAAASSRVQFLGIAYEEKGAIAQRFERVDSVTQRNGITFQQVIGNSELASAFGGIDVIPTVLLVSRDGRLAETFGGLTDPARITEAIQKLDH